MDWKEKTLVTCALIISTFQGNNALGDFHYPPPRLDCTSPNGNSITFFQYATGNQNRKRYNGKVYYGSVGEQSSFDYDDIEYVELQNNSLRFTGKPNVPAEPTFEMHLDRIGNSYVGTIDFSYPNGSKAHWNFQYCNESKFCS